MSSHPLPKTLVREAVAAALSEDLGLAGDITSHSTIPEYSIAVAKIVARQPGVVSGIDLAVESFRQIDPEIDITIASPDGANVAPSQAIIEIKGNTRSILAGERVALNFLGHLCGVATATQDLVNEVRETNARVVCTRKTTPGLRAFEKYAVVCGGGMNHRFGLFDAVMIKDNHVAACGGVKEALAAARHSVGHTVKIEIEIDGLDQLDDAIAGGADIIMLDNMSPEDMKTAVERTRGQAILEASGNVTIASIRAIAETGVDIISSGWITHSAPSLDIGLDFC